MAKINENLLVRGARGNVGKQYVYKKRGKDTHIARMPSIKTNAIVTEKQVKVRDLFASASLYAQGAMSSPELKKEYEKKAGDGKTSFNVAFRDYVKAPVVTKIDTEKYTGAPGSVIVVSARDDFRVAEVKVSIYISGMLFEEGNAVLQAIDRGKWTYTATMPNTMPEGSVIKATAIDLPGNKGVLEVSL